jgi:hypothetical protein
MTTLTEAQRALQIIQNYLNEQTVAPSGQAPSDGTPGHEVTENPPFSVTTRGTVFGLNYDGTNDIGDLDPREPDGNSRGFFIDPVTRQQYVTHSQDLLGCSLPREVLLSTFLGVDAWESEGIDRVWGEYARDVQNFVLQKRPTLDIDSGGKFTITGVPLVDAGPKASTHNGLDLTYKASHALQTFGAALCTYRILLDGQVQKIGGWDWTNNRVIGS